MELYHYGIKGQKWGVRRFQNKDGTLTNAGKKRYSEDVENAKASLSAVKANQKSAKKEYNKAYNLYNIVPTKKNYEKLQETSTELQRVNKEYKDAKTDYQVAKIDAKGGFDQSVSKSNHRSMLEETYRKQGYDEKQAAVMADNRIKAEKVLVATAALTVTACAAYAANKYIKNRTDSYIKSGSTLQRITSTDSKTLHDMFYASSGKHDNKRYEGLLGGTRIQQTGKAYLKELQANKDVKVASKENASKIFGDLYKNDSEFRKSVEEFAGQHFNGSNKVDVNNLSSKNIRKLYENFNSGLIHIRESGSGADQKFYNRMREAGYGAIQDINDMKYSGYNAKNPLIIFDSNPNAFMMKSVSQLRVDDAKNKHSKELAKTLLESAAKQNAAKIAAYTTVGTSAAAAKMYMDDRIDSREANATRGSKIYVEQYKKEHPNTQLTDAQIKEMYTKRK